MNKAHLFNALRFLREIDMFHPQGQGYAAKWRSLTDWPWTRCFDTLFPTQGI